MIQPAARKDTKMHDNKVLPNSNISAIADTQEGQHDTTSSKERDTKKKNTRKDDIHIEKKERQTIS